jgi:hypothetical protein
VLLAPLLEKRQQQTLVFARTGAGGHECVAGSAGQQPFEGLLLMAVGRKGKGDLGKPVPPGPLLERQPYRDIGPFKQALAIGQNTINETLATRRGGVEGGADGSGILGVWPWRC